MKRLIVSSATVATLLLSAVSPAFANVITPDGQTTGSAQVLANPSASGTITNDGTRPIWVD